MPHTGLELSVDRRRVASPTREERTGPYTLMLATAIPELGLRLYSTYVCSQHTDSVAVHLELGTDPKRPLAVRRYPHGELPVVQARQRCWLEHAAHLQQFVGDVTGRRVAIDVAPGAGGPATDTHGAL